MSKLSLAQSSVENIRLVSIAYTSPRIEKI